MSITMSEDPAHMIEELYQLAVLVYLNRASDNLLNQWSRTQKQIDRAFAMLARLKSCDRQFPVFIFGAEARTDERRAIILDLIMRTTKGSVSSRSYNHTRLLLQAMWAQDDLADGGEIKYFERMSNMITLCAIMPTFV